LLKRKKRKRKETDTIKQHRTSKSEEGVEREGSMPQLKK